MSKYVVSTLTASVRYQLHTQPSNEKELPMLIGEVMVHGGANIRTVRGGFGEFSSDEQGIPMYMPNGVVTPITEAQAEMLSKCYAFQQDVKSGHVQIIDSVTNIGENHGKVKEIVNNSMKPSDSSAPIKAKTYGKIKTQTGAPVDPE